MIKVQATDDVEFNSVYIGSKCMVL